MVGSPTLLIIVPTLGFLPVCCRGLPRTRCAGQDVHGLERCCSSTGRASQSIALFSNQLCHQDARFRWHPRIHAELGSSRPLTRASHAAPRMTGCCLGPSMTGTSTDVLERAIAAIRRF